MLTVSIPSINNENVQYEVEGVKYADVGNASNLDMVADVLMSPSGLGSIKQGQDKHFYSDGAFNLIQLLLYVIKQTGPAHVFLTTYSIADESIKALKRMVDNGEILSIRYIVDNRVRSISPKNFDLLVCTFPGCYRCRALHAKVALVYNDAWTISIIGSQNATRNPKLERGVIHTSKPIFEYDKNCLEYEFDHGTT